jgi:hypothetical protein
VLCQRVKGHGASSMARLRGRGRSVGSQGGRQSDARQVFDDVLLIRAREIEADRARTKALACLGKLKGA